MLQRPARKLVCTHSCRYGLVRVRENAESIAFYGGEASERRLLFDRLRAVVENYADLLKTSRNLEFFTSFYRQVAWLCVLSWGLSCSLPSRAKRPIITACFFCLTLVR